ncbi:MAG: septum site-determining protein MinC [Anaerolineae bacterium]|nr:septum site-determining protein MinC [Anaerolineae bacterium]
MIESSSHEPETSGPAEERATFQTSPNRGARSEQRTRIKGTREGLTITLGVGEFSQLLSELSDHLANQGAFFRGGRVALEVGDRPLRQTDLESLRDLLEQYDMIFRTVVTPNLESQHAARALGLRIVEPSPPQETETWSSDVSSRTVATSGSMPQGSRGILVRHLVRSGQVVRHTGHVAIIGDVNPGAAVIAGGDIVVWGRLYGMAHAGSMGDESAVVCALEMAPMQLRIGQIIARQEDGIAPHGRADTVPDLRYPSGTASDSEAPIHPEVAYVDDAKILIARWDTTRRGA